jgi:outer membrane protein assembly factor BamB
MKVCRAIALLALLGLGGCGGDRWWGAPDAPPLPGTRIPVMLLEDGVAADARLADLRVELPPPFANTAWPQSGGGAAKAMHHLAAPGELRQVWRASIGQGSGGARQLLTPPIVADGRVFAVDASAAVSAVDLASGRRLWRFDPGSRGSRQLGGGLAHDAGWLFLAASDGRVIALEAESGREIWRRSLNAPLRSAPTVAGGRVLILSADNQLFALDGPTGQVTWRHAGVFETASFLGGPSPAVAEGVVVVPYSSGEVFALRLEDGVPLWADIVQRPRRTLGLAAINDINGHPVIDRERVYVVGHGGEMAAIELRRGARLWDVQLVSTETPWVAGDFLYVLTDRAEVVCLLRQGGRIRWVSPLQRNRRPNDPTSETILWTGPVLAGDRLVVAGSHGETLTLSPYTGEILGRLTVGAPVRQPPVVAEGTLIVLTERGDLLAFR